MTEVVKQTKARRVIPSTREGLLVAIKGLYEVNGFVALSTPFLEKEGLYARMHSIGLSQPIYLEALGLTEQYAEWREKSRTYAGKVRPKWTWEEVVEKARLIKDDAGELPAMDWFRKKGHTSLVILFLDREETGRDLREALGSFEKSRVRTSRNGMRWLSQPEVSMSDFLYGRGIKHKAGERYEEGYAEQSGRHHGQYDMHFVASDGRWVDVEIWGNIPDHLAGGKYAETRALKETWNAGRGSFLGIESQDCLTDKKLTAILEPFIGLVQPFKFERSLDLHVDTTRWTSAEELLVKCKKIAAKMPDGIFPNEQWLRKRGKYADRPGDNYGSFAHYINEFFHEGIRQVRKELGQDEHSTTKWTPETAIQAWRDFHTEHGVTPTQMFVKERAKQFPSEVVKLAQNIRRAVTTHGVLNEARDGKTAHKVIWTQETVRSAWREFELKHGRRPGARISGEFGNQASRIYNAARKLKMLDELRSNPASIAKE